MKRRALAALTAAVLTSVMLGGTALAASVDPVLVDGNPVCSGTGGPSGPSLGFDYGIKVDPPKEGTFNVGAGTVTISDIDTSVNPATFNWSASNVVILAVIVKGGSSANVYYYPNPPGSYADTGLHAPNGFSHINFCYDDAQMPGTLKVKKVVDGGPEGFEATFPVTVDCGDGGTFSGDINYPNTGYRTFIDLPAGAQCTVTEGTLPAAPDGYTWGDPTYTGNPATIKEDGKSYVTVTNHLNLIPPPEVGSLKVTKEIPGVPEGFTGSFDIRVTCTGDLQFDRTIEYPDPGFVTVNDIPAGAECLVIELAKSDPPVGLNWGGANINGPVTIAANQTADLTVTNLLVEEQGVPILGLVKSNNATVINNVPTADEGGTVTYTLNYGVQDGPVTNGVLKDVLPVGVTYVAGSATDGAPFTFESYNSATRTLLWLASSVNTSGSVTYKVTIDVGAAELEQPLTNTATIDSDETEPVSDTSNVSVTVPVKGETNAPTAPPTDISGTNSDVSGGSMLLVLLALVGVVGVMLTIAPVPASLRRRK